MKLVLVSFKKGGDMEKEKQIKNVCDQYDKLMEMVSGILHELDCSEGS